MLDIISRGSLLITAITGYTPDHYSWKSHAVQIDSLVMDRHAGRRLRQPAMSSCGPPLRRLLSNEADLNDEMPYWVLVLRRR